MNDRSKERLFIGAIYAAVAFVAWLSVMWFPAHAKWDRVAGEWEQYRLNEGQMNWFGSVKSKQGVACCNIADGHPTEMQRREDGVYIPDPMHTDGPWLLVPKEAMTVQGTNPVGVAVVWYVIQITQDDRNIHIRCFVPEAET